MIGFQGLSSCVGVDPELCKAGSQRSVEWSGGGCWMVILLEGGEVTHHRLAGRGPRRCQS